MQPRLTLALGAALSLACATAPPVGTGHHLDREAANQCRRHCADLGLELSAVVIIRTSAGCVCEPAAAGARREGGAAVAGGAAIQAIEEEAQRQRSTQGGTTGAR